MLVALGALNLLVMRPAIAQQLRDAAYDAGARVARKLPAGCGGRSIVRDRSAGDDGGIDDRIASVHPVRNVGAGRRADPNDGRGRRRGSDAARHPGIPGRNTMDFILDGIPDDKPIETFLVRFTYLDKKLGTTEDEATAIHPTHFQLTGGQLSLDGKWQIKTIARRTGFDDVTATFEVDIKAAAAATPSGPTPTLAPLPTIVGERVDISASNSESFDQDSVSAPSGPVTLVFTNNDAGIPHNLNLIAESGGERRSIVKTEIERGPNRQAVTVQVPSGTYTYICDVHPAMQGTLHNRLDTAC